MDGGRLVGDKINVESKAKQHQKKIIRHMVKLQKKKKNKFTAALSGE